MTLDELMNDFGTRYNVTHEQGTLLGADMRAAGIRDGLPLYDAYTAWRAQWKVARCPTAAQFAAFYVEPSIHTPHASGLSNRERMLADMELSNRPDSYRNTIRSSG